MRIWGLGLMRRVTAIGEGNGGRLCSFSGAMYNIQMLLERLDQGPCEYLPLITSGFCAWCSVAFGGASQKRVLLGHLSTHREYEKVVGVAVHSFFRDNVEELTHRRADAACRIRSKYMVCSFSKSELFDAGS